MRRWRQRLHAQCRCSGAVPLDGCPHMRDSLRAAPALPSLGFKYKSFRQSHILLLGRAAERAYPELNGADINVSRTTQSQNNAREAVPRARARRGMRDMAFHVRMLKIHILSMVDMSRTRAGFHPGCNWLESRSLCGCCYHEI